MSSAIAMTRASRNSPTSQAASIPMLHGNLLQRKCGCGGSAGMDGKCEDCRKNDLGVQRLAASPGQGSSLAPPIVHEVLRSPGQPLDAGTRAFMEPRFGHDFSRVRIHNDARAEDSARAVAAHAYTVGSHVVFGPSRYAPGTRDGRKLLAHELTHVIQQRPTGPSSTLAVGLAADPHERQAESIAEEVASTTEPKTALEPPIGTVAPTIQRDADSDEYKQGYQDGLNGNDAAPGPRDGDALTDYNEGYAKGHYEFTQQATSAKADSPAAPADATPAPANATPGPADATAPVTPPTEFVTTADPADAGPANAADAGPPAAAPAPAAMSDATGAQQAACVVRLGGCPSSRDGGLPSTDDIANYNQQCSVTTQYAGPDIIPTADDCEHPQTLPLSPAEQILLGTFLTVVGVAAATAVIVLGAEALPVLATFVSDAAVAGNLFYVGNAIVINEIAPFVAGLLISCEGNVPALLQTLANDPAQALLVLAEVITLSVNIQVGNQPTRRASVPTQLLPPEEQTGPQIGFKTVGAPVFDETSEVTPNLVEGDDPVPVAASPPVTLVAKGDPLERAATWIKPKPGVIDVVVHGTPDTFEILKDGKWAQVSHRTLATLIEKSGESGETIRLISCSAGACPTGVAQNLANKVGMQVVAPDDTLWVHPNGDLTIGKTPKDNTGQWVTFNPGGP